MSLCSHIYDNLTLCKNKNGYNSTNKCRLHFRDIDCSTKESKIQSKRLDRLRKRLKDTGFYFGD